MEAHRKDVLMISSLAVRTLIPTGSARVAAARVRWLLANRSPMKLLAAPLSIRILQSLLPNWPLNMNVSPALDIAPQDTIGSRLWPFLSDGALCKQALCDSKFCFAEGNGVGGPGKGGSVGVTNCPTGGSHSETTTCARLGCS